MDDRAKTRWRCWWNATALDRPIVQLYAPRKPRPEGNRISDSDPKAAWSDIASIFERNLAYLDNTRFLGEATHVINPNWSVGNACFFGCEPLFRCESVWTHPLPVEEDGFPIIRFDPENRWLQWMLAFTEYAAQRNDGRFHLAPYFGNSAADTLSLLCTDAELMVHIIEDPEWVRQSLSTIGKAVYAIYHRASRIIGDKWGYTSWFGCAADQPVAMADADISCMISSKQFEDIFLAQIAEQIAQAPYSQYHLDGPGALHHLDALLALKDLNAIQWVPGDGSGSALKWIPLIRRIQQANKAVQVYLKPEEVMPILDEVKPDGLCMTVNCSCESQAEALFEAIERRYRLR